MRPKTNTSQRWRIVAAWVAGALVLIAGAVGGYQYLTRDMSPIPLQIRTQLTFSPFVIPKGTKNYPTTDYKFDTAEGTVQRLSYLIHLPDSIVTVTEYTQPSEFTEIPEYKDLFLNNAKQYATVQTSNGTIYLGRLALQNSQQVGILLERGLVVFISPDKELEAAQWRNLGDQLEIQKVIN